MLHALSEVLALSQVEATVMAAAIGGAAGVMGGVGGHLVAGHFDRKSVREQRQIADLIAVQDVLAHLNRLHYRIYKERKREPAIVPDQLWEDFVATRGEVLSLNERIVSDELRKSVHDLRESYSAQWWSEAESDSARERLNESYKRVQELLGHAIRRRLR